MLADRHGSRRRHLLVETPELRLSRRCGSYCVTNFLVAQPGRVVSAQVDGELREDRDAVHLAAPADCHLVEVEVDTRRAHQQVEQLAILLAVHRQEGRRSSHPTAEVLHVRCKLLGDSTIELDLLERCVEEIRVKPHRPERLRGVRVVGGVRPVRVEERAVVLLDEQLQQVDEPRA